MRVLVFSALAQLLQLQPEGGRVQHEGLQEGQPGQVHGVHLPGGGPRARLLRRVRRSRGHRGGQLPQGQPAPVHSGAGGV